jgi:hypothetical protein
MLELYSRKTVSANSNRSRSGRDMNAEAQLHNLTRHKVKAYRWLYEFTASACTDCALTDCACKDTICQHVERQAGLKGMKFSHTGHRLRFIGCGGCVVPPHLRETCTIYLCARAQEKPQFRRRRYEKLKKLCSVIEEKLMRLEEADAPNF